LLSASASRESVCPNRELRSEDPGPEQVGYRRRSDLNVVEQIDLVVVASFVCVSGLGDGQYASDADLLDAELSSSSRRNADAAGSPGSTCPPGRKYQASPVGCASSSREPSATIARTMSSISGGVTGEL
jgi:hypothetical protein